MIKAVMFDLDGTLLNRNYSVRSFIDQQYERLKSNLSHILKENYVHRFIELDIMDMYGKIKSISKF